MITKGTLPGIQPIGGEVGNEIDPTLPKPKAPVPPPPITGGQATAGQGIGESGNQTTSSMPPKTATSPLGQPGNPDPLAFDPSGGTVPPPAAPATPPATPPTTPPALPQLPGIGTVGGPGNPTPPPLSVPYTPTGNNGGAGGASQGTSTGVGDNGEALYGNRAPGTRVGDPGTGVAGLPGAGMLGMDKLRDGTKGHEYLPTDYLADDSQTPEQAKADELQLEARARNTARANQAFVGGPSSELLYGNPGDYANAFAQGANADGSYNAGKAADASGNGWLNSALEGVTPLSNGNLPAPQVKSLTDNTGKPLAPDVSGPPALPPPDPGLPGTQPVVPPPIPSTPGTTGGMFSANQLPGVSAIGANPAPSNMQVPGDTTGFFGPTDPTAPSSGDTGSTTAPPPDPTVPARTTGPTIPTTPPPDGSLPGGGTQLPGIIPVPTSGSTSTLPGAGSSGTGGYPYTNPNDSLLNHTITAPDPQDRFKIAQDQLDAFTKSTDPAYQAALRSAMQSGAAGGRVGSGMLRTSLGDLASNRGLQLDTEKTNFLDEALKGTIQDAQYAVSVAQQQQGFQFGQQQTSFQDSVMERQLQETLQSGAFQRSLQQLLAGSSSSPSDIGLALSGIFANLAKGAGAAGQGVAGAAGAASQNGSQIDSATLQALTQLLKSYGINI